nr:TIGR02281 family clan AA aspartic protease [uncultured Cohaesibacter sp.]
MLAPVVETGVFLIMARLIFMAIVFVVLATLLPGVATDWLVANGYLAGDDAAALLNTSSADKSSKTTNYNGVNRVVLKPGPGGHFYAQAYFNNKTVRTLIDTGASTVALTHEDARRIGIHPNAADYKEPVRTGNGLQYYARARVSSVRIGQVRVHNLDLLVAPKGALSVTLMGMSYLRKLKTIRVERGRLILEN